MILARRMLERCVSGTAQVSPDCYREALDLPALQVPRGAFVTLHNRGELRGCIGYIEPIVALAQAVAENAVSAATRDYRFPPLQATELADIAIEISALTVPELLGSPSDIRIGEHGLIVSMGRTRGLLLPQVAVEHDLSPMRFLEETCRKAGLPRDAWSRGAKVECFTAEVFSEASVGLTQK